MPSTGAESRRPEESHRCNWMQTVAGVRTQLSMKRTADAPEPARTGAVLVLK